MTDSGSEIVRAAFTGDVDAARRALAADPECADAVVDGIGSRPLHCASHRGYTAIVEALIDAGADVDAFETCSGSTPLHWAAEGGHLDVARLLVQAGAELESLDTWHRLRPVDWGSVVQHNPSVHDDREAVVEYLEALGSESGIFGAVARGMTERLLAIVESEPEALAQRLGPASGLMQPLHLAMASGAEAVAEVLIGLGAPLHDLTSRGHSPLALAVAAGSQHTVDLLSSAGVVVDLPTALQQGDYELAGRLLDDLGKDALGAAGPFGPLVHAFAGDGPAEALDWLLRNGADPELPAVYLGHDEWLTELQPLHLAAARGDTETMGLLIAAGADRDGRDGRSGLTPLHMAAASGREAAIRELLAAGADATITDLTYGATPAGWASHSGHDELATLLAATGE